MPFLALDHPVTERVIAFTSASKGWNIPGLKCGVAIAGSPAAAAVLSERWDALLAAEPGRAGLGRRVHRGAAWLDAMLAQIDEQPDLLAAAAGASTCPPWATSRPRPASWPGWTAARWAWATTRRPRSWSGAGSRSAPAPTSAPPGRGYARLNMGTSPELLAEAVRRMAAAVT